MPRFIIFLITLAIIVYAILYAGNQQGYFQIPSFGLEIILYMLFSTALIFNILRKRLGPVLFTQLYLLTIVIKMVTGSIFILIIIYLDRSGASANAVFFVVSYFLFTALEVVFLYRHVGNLPS